MATQLTNEDFLRDLLDKIQEIRRVTIGSISILSGYKHENYLSERLSSKGVSEKIIKRVSSLYEKAKIDPNVLTDVKNNEAIVDKITIQDTPGSNQEFLIRLLAKVNVLFSNEAEKIAQKEGRKATDVLREMDKAAMDEANILYKELLKKR